MDCPLTQSAKRRAQGVRLKVNGNPIMPWLRDCSPFAIYRSLFFFAMRHALCSVRSDLALRTRFSMLNKNRTHYTALYTVSKARITIRPESPISNQKGFVLRESLLPTLAPIVDPMSTNNAGNQNIFPRCQ